MILQIGLYIKHDLACGVFYLTDLGAGSEDVKKIRTKTFVGNFSGTTTKTELHTVGRLLIISIGVKRYIVGALRI